MKVGIIHLPTDESLPVHRLAVEAEQRGVESMFVGGHTHIPAARVSPFPVGIPLPEEYRRLYDPFVALAAAAVRTSRIRLGTCIHLTAQHDPIVTAKQVASVDHLSGGRVEYGVGYGWNVEEAADHGVEWKSRRRRVREAILAMRTLWTEEEATFHGEFVDFDRAWMWPKPVSPPPVLLGAGRGPRNFAAMVEWADGWLPVPTLGDQPEDVLRLREVAESAGRDPATISINVDGVGAEPRAIEPWLAVGADRILLGVPSLPYDEVAPVLDAVAGVVACYQS
jgi:probable F420-dependent oxidoreductase